MNDIGWPKAGEHMLPHLFGTNTITMYHTVWLMTVGTSFGAISPPKSTTQRGFAIKNGKCAVVWAYHLVTTALEDGKLLISVKDLISPSRNRGRQR